MAVLKVVPPTVDLTLYRQDHVEVAVNLSGELLASTNWKCQVKDTKQGNLVEEIGIKAGATSTSCVLVFTSAITESLCDQTPDGKPWTGFYDVELMLSGTPDQKRTVIQGSITVNPDVTIRP